MKVLHTADWHLGQKFHQKLRLEEHDRALDWLVDLISKEQVEMLIIAGDIFDVEQPTNQARRQYFNFLTKLVKTCCKNIIIIAGNHDSPLMLDASSDLLKLLNIHVVSIASEETANDIVEIYDDSEKLKAVVAAVPFLREQDLRRSVSGLGNDERALVLRRGIAKHFENIAQACEKYTQSDIPIITTGHLYASGAERDDRPNMIYLQDTENVKAEDFPELFSYVALGHLHRPQLIGGQERIQYSGSLIPLDFNEINYKQSVNIISFKGKKIDKIARVQVPLFKKLIHLKGTFEEVLAKLQEKADKAIADNIYWVKAEVITESYIPDLYTKLAELCLNDYIEVILVRQLNANKAAIENYQTLDLAMLSELELFEMRCDLYGKITPETKNQLKNTFVELLDSMKSE